MALRPTIALAFLAAAVWAQGTRAPDGALEPGAALRGEMAGGQRRVWALRLERGEFARVVVAQPRIATVLRLLAPNGKDALVVRYLSAEQGREQTLIFVAEAAGEYQVELAALTPTGNASGYEIRLEERRAATDADRARVAVQEQEDRERELKTWLAMIPTVRQFGGGREEATLLIYIARTYEALHQYAEAVGYYAQARAALRRTGDRVGEADLLGVEADVYSALGQDAKALAEYEEVLEMDRALKDRGREGRTLANLGTEYIRLNEYQKAIGYFERAREVMAETKDREGEANVLNGAATAWNSLGQAEKAVEPAERSLEIYRELGDGRGESTAADTLGNAYYFLSRYGEAVAAYEEALRIAREGRDRRREAVIANNLASVYDHTEQHAEALRYYELGLAIRREVRDRQGEGAALDSLGYGYWRMHQADKAVQYGSQALAIARETGDRKGEADALMTLGMAHGDLRQTREEIGELEGALGILRGLGNRGGEAAALNNLGSAYGRLLDGAKAQEYYEQALGIAREVKDRRGEAYTLGNLMTVWSKSNPRLAIFYGKQAVNAVQSMRSDMRALNQEVQRGFARGNESPYRALAGLLIGQGRLAEAERVLRLLKEEEYFEYVRGDAKEEAALDGRAEPTADEAEWQKRYAQIADRLVAIGVEWRQLRNTSAERTLTAKESARLDTLVADLEAGNHAFNRFLDEMAAHFAREPETRAKVERWKDDSSIMEVLPALPAGTVAIYTVVGQDRYSAVLFTAGAPKWYTQAVGAEELNRKIAAFREAVKDPRIDPRPAGRELYRILIAPMEEDLRQAGAVTLMWSLDGALRYVPLGALWDGEHYLVERYRTAAFTPVSRDRLQGAPDRHWRAAGFGVTTSLPEVSAELNGIIASKGGEGGVLEGEIKLDADFTERSLVTALRKRYPVVHIASHFLFRPGNKKESFLLLGDGGKLSLDQLENMQRPFEGVQLLTLSACDTGLGDGKEVESFGVQAQREGARAVIASLWEVGDASTSLLMQEFYRVREAHPGMTKVEALRTAQLELLRGKLRERKEGAEARSLVHGRPGTGAEAAGPRFTFDPAAPYAHPYYWAPFFLMGNWM